MNTKLIVRLLGYLIVLSGVFVYAQEDPRMWDTEGVALRQGDHMEWYKSNAVNEQGQTCVTWCDARAGYWDIYAQVIAPDGRRLWPDRGLLINNAEWRQEDPVVVAVDGGWVFAWIDWRYGDRYHFGTPSPRAALFAQKVSATGEILWAVDGVEIYNLENYYIIDSSLRLTDDRAGGAIIGWREYQPDPGYNFRVQRVNNLGTLVWNEPLMVTNSIWWGNAVQTVPDEEGNMFVVWYADVDSVTRNVFGAKVTLDGTLPWGDGLNGIKLQSFAGMCDEIDLCGDEITNGFYITWDVQNESYWDHNYYAQRFDNNGVRLWGDDGILLYEPADHVINLELTPSYDLGTQDGILITGRALTEPAHHLIAQKIDLNGNLWWGNDGVVAGEINGYNTWELPSIQTDYEGGCIALWSYSIDDAAPSEPISFLRASRLDNSGNPLWGNGGITLQSGDMDWRYQGLISHIEGSDFARAFYMDEDYLGFKSISIANGSQISETAVRVLPFIQGEASRIASVPLADARAAVIWQDGRHNDDAIYYQIVDTLGTYLLEEQGRLLFPNSDSQVQMSYANTRLCSDGGEGFFVSVSEGYGDMRPQILIHVELDESLNHTLSQAMVSDSTAGYESSFIVPDGDGGCYVVWDQYTPEFQSYTKIQRFSDQCEPLWPAPVQLTVSDTYWSSDYHLTETSDGCCVVFWYSGIQGGRTATAAKINRLGEIAWSVDLCEGIESLQSMSCKPDHDGGVYIIWNAPYEVEYTGIFIQHVNAEGEELWTHGGISLAAPDGWYPQILVNEISGLYVLWTNNGLYAQRLDENGTSLWAPEGIQLSSDSDINSNDINMSLNGEGGLFCVWNSYMENTSNLYGMNILPDGAPSSDWWVEGEGNLLVQNDRNVSGTKLTPFGDGSSLIVWEGILYAEDEYAANQSKPNYHYIIDLYMQRISVGQVIEAADEGQGATPLSYALNQNYPNPFNPTTTISFSIAKAGTVSLVVYDLLGRSVTTLLNERLNSGNYQVPWDASALPSGMYFYRLQAGEFSDVKKTVLLK